MPRARAPSVHTSASTMAPRSANATMAGGLSGPWRREPGARRPVDRFSWRLWRCHRSVGRGSRWVPLLFETVYLYSCSPSVCTLSVMSCMSVVSCPKCMHVVLGLNKDESTSVFLLFESARGVR
ncbi:hypothetical protein BCR44DRAFT_1440660 [Catenaria anguillulae PL171]|uniref:Uncharacterized protein n=1 Tax=Catenaria anguillulae PL171 TaxID=765915 RepID=A0A1Y2HCA0_9FUNG|nr:hypothetical protein BCR44DRAFT_1440660 [Catenaria anguillulae PL171]